MKLWHSPYLISVARGYLLIGIIFMCCAPIYAEEVITPMHFADPKLAVRFNDLSAEFRCPKCENQSLRESNAPVAADLRLRLYELLHAAHSDAEIRQHMHERYGDFILYRPRLADIGWLLWLAPVLFAGIGLLGWSIFRRQLSNRDKSTEVFRDTSACDMEIATDEEQALLATSYLRYSILLVVCAALVLLFAQTDWSDWWIYQQFQRTIADQDSARAVELLGDFLRTLENKP